MVVKNIEMILRLGTIIMKKHRVSTVSVRHRIYCDVNDNLSLNTTPSKQPQFMN